MALRGRITCVAAAAVVVLHQTTEEEAAAAAEDIVSLVVKCVTFTGTFALLLKLEVMRG